MTTIKTLTYTEKKQELKRLREKQNVRSAFDMSHIYDAFNYQRIEAIIRNNGLLKAALGNLFSFDRKTPFPEAKIIVSSETWTGRSVPGYKAHSPIYRGKNRRSIFLTSTPMGNSDWLRDRFNRGGELILPGRPNPILQEINNDHDQSRIA
jgi:hypothetical protein